MRTPKRTSRKLQRIASTTAMVVATLGPAQGHAAPPASPPRASAPSPTAVEALRALLAREARPGGITLAPATPA